MEIIGVDTGNKNIKTTLAPAFNAGLICHGSEEPPVKVDTLFFEGEYYSLTEMRNAYRRDKTVDDSYYHLTLIAIAKQLIAKHPDRAFYNEQVCLSIGLPPAHLTNLRKRFIDYFIRDGKAVEYLYNGIRFEITIARVLVYPQGFAAIVPYLDEIVPHTRSYIIDIGGYTADIIRLNHGVPDMNFCESVEMGSIQLYEAVRRAIRARCYVEADDYLIDAILRGDEHPDETIEAIAKSTAEDYATQLMRSLEEKGVDTVLSYLIFVGGGALLMKDAIRSEIKCKDALCIENINANAIGYETAADAQLKRDAREAKINATAQASVEAPKPINLISANGQPDISEKEKAENVA